MRVVLRADAGVTQGTGHVMRCITLAEELRSRGHEVHLVTHELAIDWLSTAVAASGVTVHPSALDTLSTSQVVELHPDWVVVDSYRIPAREISLANDAVPVLAIVDEDTRDIRASLYLDQNLGAERVRRPSWMEPRMLAGAEYVLVRDAVLEARRPEPWLIQGGRATIVSFMGGTDPTGACTHVVRELVHADVEADLVVVAPGEQHEAIRSLLAGRSGAEVLLPTPDLPQLFARADIVVSAAGTSAWDLCTLGVPSVLMAVVENQSPSLAEAVARGAALGLDVSDDVRSLVGRLGALVITLLSEEATRHRLSMTSREIFDGEGKSRVVDRMEQEVVGR